MKSISTHIKLNVIKLFLLGYSYDEIHKQLGIGKGTVASIVDDFRSGVIPVPPGMGEYVDALRQLVVDLKKHHTTVTQVLPYVKLHAKMKEMGVDEGQVDTWLDICKGITSQGASNNQFVQAAIELAEATAINGQSYSQLLHDYDKKLDLNKKLDGEIKNKKKEIVILDKEHASKVEHYTSELKTITDAAKTAQAMFEQQTEELMHQKNLTFDEVNTVSAILTTELGKIELNKENIKQISKRISEAGSLTVHIKNIEEQKQKLEAEIQELTKVKAILENSVKKLQMKIKNDEMVIVGQEFKKDQLEAEIKAKEPELKELRKTIDETKEIISQAHLVVAFLITPKSLKEKHLDNLVQFLIALRQKSLGIEPKKVEDANGKIICKCQVPIIDNLDTINIDMDSVRIQLALNLTPLVKDQFVPITLRWSPSLGQDKG